METIKTIAYNLTPEDVEKIEFTVRYITDRQDRPSYYIPGKGTFAESYSKSNHRRDMFWLTCILDNEDLGCLVIEPDMEDSRRFHTQRNHNKVSGGYSALINRAKEWFLAQPEYQQQIIWVESLINMVKEDEKNNFQDTLVSK